MPRKSTTYSLTVLAGAVLLAGGVAGCGGSKSAVATRADEIVAAVNAQSASSGVNSKEVIWKMTFHPDMKFGPTTVSAKGVTTGEERGTLWVRQGETCYLVTGYADKDAASAAAACTSASSSPAQKWE